MYSKPKTFIYKVTVIQTIATISDEVREICLVKLL